MGEHFNFLDDPSPRSQLREMLETHLETLSSSSEASGDMNQAFAALAADKWFRHMLSTVSNKELESIATQLALGEYAKKTSSNTAHDLAADSPDINIAAIKDHINDENRIRFGSELQEFYLKKLLDLRTRAQEIAKTVPDTRDIN